MTMRMDERPAMRRPRGAVLRPLGLLIAAIASGVGMWRVLMRDDGSPAAQLSRYDAPALAHGSDATPH
jgi:ABC-type Zn2+ transport system substrate-binding protein/surface adhesin